jgi:hypothetical protein
MAAHQTRLLLQQTLRMHVLFKAQATWKAWPRLLLPQQMPDATVAHGRRSGRRKRLREMLRG